MISKGCQSLLLQASDGKDSSSQGDLACHRHILLHRNSAKSGEESHGDGDSRRGSVLRDGACRYMDVDILPGEVGQAETVCSAFGSDIGEGGLGRLLHDFTQVTG